MNKVGFIGVGSWENHGQKLMKPDLNYISSNEQRVK